MQRFGIRFLPLPDDLRRAVGRTVVDNQQVEFFGKREDLVDHRTDVVQFVVGRDDNQIPHSQQMYFETNVLILAKSGM